MKQYIPQSVKNIFHKLQALWANVRTGFPATSLKVIGVTGTDGKTTTATMIYHILKENGFSVGLITSVSARIGEKEVDTGFHVTTPDPWKIPYYLQEMLRNKIQWVVLEITSHALDQNRVAYTPLEKAVFTNITKEHLDYHRTWKNLAQAKVKLIDLLSEGGEVIYHQDKRGAKTIERKMKRSKKVLLKSPCNRKEVTKKRFSREGISFKMKINNKEREIKIPILGEYNIANAQCAIKACDELVPSKKITKALADFSGIPGRMQIVRSEPKTVIVDFAHTTNALKNALQAVDELKGKARVIVVFGCAGERDAYKRKKMGMIAAKYADIVVITAEDPRSEKLAKINDSILSGAVKKRGQLLQRFADHDEYQSVSISLMKEEISRTSESKEKNRAVFAFDQESPQSRSDAIDFSLNIAEEEDIVLIAGKGHEKSLCFGTTEYPWSDVQAIQDAETT